LGLVFNIVSLGVVGINDSKNEPQSGGPKN
jgi:hypothetical protein